MCIERKEEEKMWPQQQQQQQQPQPRSYLGGLALQHSQQHNVDRGVVDPDDLSQHQQQRHHHYHHHHQQQQQQQQQHLQHQHNQRGPVTMDLSLPSNPRASRNMAEKQRRDNLNTNISTMAALVPTVAASSKRLDKISILRLAAAHLRTYYAIGSGTKKFLPSQLEDIDLEQFLIDTIGSVGFCIVVTTSGKIVYVSQQVERQLGHAQRELIGQSLYHFVYPEDHEELTRNLTPDEMQPIVNTGMKRITDGDCNSNSSEESSTSSQKTSERRLFREQRRSFKLRMSQRTVSRREHTQYECLHVTGVLRLADAVKKLENRTRNRESTSTSNDIIFVGIAWLPKKRPITELSLIDANKQEYVTRHLVDGRIIYCDHRISIVAGYMSEEVSGLCAFNFMHKDDFRWTIIGLRQMYDRAEPCGSSCYRLLSKTGEFIYLKTYGYLEYDKDTQTVESFVCVNTLVSDEEGIECVREMKKRFSATVSGATKAMIQNNDDPSFDLGSDSQGSNSKGNLEDPLQVEDAVTHLISDLPSSEVSNDRLSSSRMPNAQFAKAAVISQRLPSAATQASQIGIKKIDHYLVMHGKGNRTPKQEPRMEIKQERQSIGKIMSPDAIVEQETILDVQQYVGRKRTQDRDSIGSLSPGQPLAMQEMAEQVRTVQEKSLNNGISRENVLRLNVLSERETPDVNIIKNSPTEAGNQPRQQNSTLEYLTNSTSESEDEELKRRHSSKRIHNEKSVRNGVNKKLRNNRQLRLEQQQHQQRDVPYTNCRTFNIGEQFSTLADFNHYNQIQSQPMRVASTDSPNSSLQDSIEYQDLDPSTPMVISNLPDDEQFTDLQELKEDPLLSPSLDANPDIMLKMLDDLSPVMGFEETFDEHAVSEEIRRTHQQLANSMAIRESHFNVLARDMDNPVLQAQRKNLTQLQAEHKMQKQILKTLQQDHRNIQVNVKHNIGV